MIFSCIFVELCISSFFPPSPPFFESHTTLSPPPSPGTESFESSSTFSALDLSVFPNPSPPQKESGGFFVGSIPGHPEPVLWFPACFISGFCLGFLVDGQALAPFFNFQFFFAFP